ncbi:DIE2 ALG10 domain containing protein [Trichuris trichiura]|uniref:Dol-P-Glc:Glc(2)Man(9)GlcNAc(2)-PP-Dol alpha-1,2-glucosyltransferase n=1 Tax=Trichuris trichiura TaxID=36087 RepID=A0A077ZPY6_TRITR|nr:DIE2 ALG10 domain containing protein [Trichuris trichiura]
MIGYVNSVKVSFLVGLAVTSIVIQLLFNKAVPFPFVDEKFHFDQLHKYCDGNFTYWNPKITTPPGLYVLSLAYVRALSLLFGSDSCTLPTVRFFNVIATLLLFNVSYALTKDKSLTSFRRALNALNCTSFPILYFSTFLYYTDCCSLLLLSCCYVMAKARQPMYSALFGLSSICIRQSNVVWVVFTAAIYFLESFEEYAKQRGFSYHYGNWRKLVMSQLFWRDVILPELSYGLVVFLFLSFAYMNGGFALGDRQAHQIQCNVEVDFLGLCSRLLCTKPLVGNALFHRSFLYVAHSLSYTSDK